jgi:hypothetical protein
MLLTKVRCIICDVNKKKYFERKGKKHDDHAQIFGAMNVTNYGDGINHTLSEMHVIQGTALQNLNFVLLLVLVLRLLLRLSTY